MIPLKKKPSIDKEAIKSSFKKVKEELNEHLEAINQNTNEVQANYEYMQKMNMKIDKLNEKLEEIRMHLDMIEAPKNYEMYTDIKLTIREQEVFLVLYTNPNFLSYNQIAKRLGLTETLVGNYLTNLVEKGIPVLKRYEDGLAFVKLEPIFKDLQTRENVLKINDKVAREYTII